jgi:alkylated DNA nucleotide flippase Atl1
MIRDLLYSMRLLGKLHKISMNFRRVVRKQGANAITETLRKKKNALRLEILRFTQNNKRAMLYAFLFTPVCGTF